MIGAMNDAGRVALWLAREAVAHHLARGATIDPTAGLPAALTEPGGVFVTIRRERVLRGCIGTIVPTQPNLAREIILNAISAATVDPRFPSVRHDELSALCFDVDLLSSLVEVDGLTDLDPGRYGIVVAGEGSKGVLLPDIEGVRTAVRQVDIARAKAGIPAGAPVTLYRFTVTRYREELP